MNDIFVNKYKNLFCYEYVVYATMERKKEKKKALGIKNLTASQVCCQELTNQCLEVERCSSRISS